MAKKAALILTLALLCWTTSSAPASSLEVTDEADNETSLLIEQVKSPDAAVRTQAICELVDLREAVSDELKTIVRDANEGLPNSNVAAKASALYLMGKLGLVQCRDVLESEREWVYHGGLPPHFSGPMRIVGTMKEKGGKTAEYSLRCLRTGQGASLVASRPKADLSQYPALKKPLSDLRSVDRKTFENAESAVLHWYRSIEQGLDSILTYNSGRLYSADVKIGAAFLMGEYRTAHFSSALFENIDIRDDNNLTANYRSSLAVDTPDSAYPCVVALIKCGRRADFEQIVRKMGDKGCSQESRELMARAVEVIDPKAAKEELDRYRKYTQTYAAVIPDSAGILGRLSSVGEIIK